MIEARPAAVMLLPAADDPTGSAVISEALTASGVCAHRLSAWPRITLRDSPNHLDRGFTIGDGNYVSARWPGDWHRFAADYVDMVWSGFRRGG